jgi:hypothetical protein
MRSIGSGHVNGMRRSEGTMTRKSDTEKGRQPDKSADRTAAPQEVITPRHVRIPKFKEKLELLYRHHPFIRRQYEFFAEVGVAPATGSNWVNPPFDPDGVRVNPGTVPAKHFNTVANVFGVPGPVLLMEDLAEFEKALATFESGRGAWDKLIRALPNEEKVEIIVNEEKRIVDPDETDEDPGLLQVRNGDEIAISIANPGLKHAVLLQQDPGGWYSLRPTRRVKETEIGDALIYPRLGPDGVRRFASIEGTGVHLVLAIFTRDPLPAWISDILLADSLDESLDKTVATFHNLLAAGPDKCRMFGRRFLVTNAPRRLAEKRGTDKSGGSRH